MFTGEGGMVTTNSTDIAEKIRFIRSHGQTGKYYHTLLGLNYRMTDVEAAIGLKQLDRLDDMLVSRRHNASIFADELGRIDGISIQQINANCLHAYHQFCILVDQEILGIDRNGLAQKLNENGIATGIHYPISLHLQPALKYLGYKKGDFSEAEMAAEEILSIPMYPELTTQLINT